MTAAVGERPVFFIHVMKTAGTTFRRHLLKRYPHHAVFPSPGAADAGELVRNMQVQDLRDLSADDQRRLRCYSGHYPYCATQLLDPAPITLTVLRQPVERIVSYLHHCKRLHPQHRGLTFDEIYDDAFYKPCFMRNHQVKVFAMLNADEPETVMDVVEIDARRLAIAKEHLEHVDVIGLQERFDEFVAGAEARLGWSDEVVNPANVGGGPEVSPALRRRIAAENEPDLEFYAFAVDLLARRAAAA